MFHGPSCACCHDFVDSRTLTVKTVGYLGAKPAEPWLKQSRTGHHSLSSHGFSGIFEDIFGFAESLIKSIADTIKKVLDAVAKAVKNIVIGIFNAIKSINWNQIFKELGKFYGNLLIYANPFNMAMKLFREFPLTSGIYKELDKFTGGALSTMDALGTITGRALRGDPISKAEFVKCALFVVQVGLVFLAGPAGSAAFNSAAVGFAAGQLRQGTLGETQLGRDILGIAQIAGYAYAAGSSINTALEEAAVREAKEEGQRYLLTRTPLGGGDLGPLIAGLAINGIDTARAGGDYWADSVKFSQSYARAGAIRETAEQIGGPFAKDIATAAVDGARDGKFDPNRVNWAALRPGISYQDLVNGLKEVYGDVSQSVASFMNSSGGQTMFPNIDFSKAGDAVAKFGSNVVEEVKRIPSNVADAITGIKAPSLSFSAPSLTSGKELIPDFSIRYPDVSLKFPELSAPQVDWEKVLDGLRFAGQLALLRRSNVRATDGSLYTVYVLEDGTIYYVRQNNNWLIIAGAAVAAVVAIGMS